MNPSSQRFDSLAANYASSEVHASSPTMDRLHELVSEDVADVCDVGCGAGHTGLSFAGKARRIVAVDPAPKMLAEVRRLADERRIGGVEAVEAPAENIPLDDESFDLVVCRLAAHHFEDVPKALREMARLVRVGGRVAVIDLEGDDEPELDELNHDLETLHDPTHMRSYTARQWNDWFAEHGLTVEASENRQREFPEGLTIKRWCELGNSGARALKQIRALLTSTPDEVLEELEIVRDGPREYRIPVRTLLIVGRKRA
jgi:ubiquinone/menaquinone biosynthesis C-methylase UbiE